MKPRKHWWIWILVGIYIWLIFRNSLMVASVSDALSSRVTHELMNILQHFGLYADFSTFHHYVRKLAHFTEFAGLELSAVSVLGSVCGRDDSAPCGWQKQPVHGYAD